MWIPNDANNTDMQWGKKTTWQVETVTADTDLLQGNLQVLVHVQGLKQVLRAVLEPHKQVTWWDSLLEAQQLDVKDQHGAAGNPSGWWEKNVLLKV